MANDHVPKPESEEMIKRLLGNKSVRELQYTIKEKPVILNKPTHRRTS
jgi:hypothetical protein